MRGQNKSSLLAVGWVALLVSACAMPRAQLAGRVVYRGESLPDATVSLQPLPEGEAVSVTTDANGEYRFESLLPGAYLLTMEKQGANPLGARSGKNPVLLATGAASWVGMQAVPWEQPHFLPLSDPVGGGGAVAGTLYLDGEVVGGAVVDLYLDEGPSTLLRGPGFRQSFPSGADGRYFFDEVPEGRYHLVARKRESGAVAGPVEEGDGYGEALANPVAVRFGAETRVDLHLVRKERADNPNADLLALARAGLRGTVVDGEGTPVAGLYVFAYRNRTIGHGMPDYRTQPTEADGAFTLALGEGGLFYVGARQYAGGSPQPGEPFGFFEGSADHGILVEAGEMVEGIRIVVQPVLVP